MQKLALCGNRCVMFYLIQRMDAQIFKTASHIDPAYAEELKRAVIKGIEVIAYEVYIDFEKISLNKKITSII